MRPMIAIIGVALAGLAACSAGSGGGGNGAAAPAAQFEAAAVTGSQTQGDDLIKMNVATGAAWFHCCGSANGNFQPIREDQAPPAGDYHLVRWDQVDARGDVNWNVYRFDRSTGRTWVFQSSDRGPFWMDVNTSTK
jgi:hypothetical protein